MASLTPQQEAEGYEVFMDDILTPWFPPEIKPVHVGEYQASVKCDPAFRRWWNGEKWSILYFSSDPPFYKNKYHGIPETEKDQVRIHWRGIYKEEPASISTFKNGISTEKV